MPHIQVKVEKEKNEKKSVVEETHKKSVMPFFHSFLLQVCV